MTIRKVSRITGWSISLMLLAVQANGQGEQQVAASVAANSRALRQYSWTMRAEATVGGQKTVGLFKMRYDLDGQPQSTPIGGGADDSGTPPELLALALAAFAYAQPSPNIMQAFIDRAEIWAGRGATGGTVRIEGDGMMTADDSVTWLIKNDKATKLDVRTSLEGEPITISAEFQTIPNGPTYVARVVALQPARSLDLKIENFEYVSNVPAPLAAATPTPPKPEKATISVGTRLRVRLSQPLTSKRNKTGDAFDAVLDEDLNVGGKVVVPRYSRVTGTLVESRRSGRVAGKARLVLHLTRLHVGDRVLPIETDRKTVQAAGSAGRDARKIAASAGLGALIGAIVDGKKGARRGATTGAGAATLSTLLTRGNEAQVSAERVFTFELRLPIEVEVK
ncbi:MAG: hypothetical protein O7D91_02865 [Planctomycetota bacterium]|nr:hypothetical protein [Planctomycetota bacterium]